MAGGAASAGRAAHADILNRRVIWWQAEAIRSTVLYCAGEERGGGGAAGNATAKAGDDVRHRGGAQRACAYTGSVRFQYAGRAGACSC